MSSLTQFFLFLPRSPLCTTGEMVVSVVSHVLRMIVVNYITANHRFLRAACRCEAVSEAALKSKPCISKSKNKFSFHVF